jgi:hypothetical protein
MTLLNEVLDAAGGLNRWNALNHFVAHLSVEGALIARRGKAGLHDEIVAEGLTRALSIRLGGVPTSDCEASLQSGLTRIEQFDAGVLRERVDPRVKFDEDAPWDDLDLAHFCCVSIWNCMTAPFVLTHPGITVEEISSGAGIAGKSHQLRAVFPADVATYATEQTYHFDDDLLLRRIDYHLGGTGGVIVDDCSAHQAFSGIVIPTLRRATQQGRDDTPGSRVAVFDVDIFDATFAADKM